MRRVAIRIAGPGVTRAQFDEGVDRIISSGFPCDPSRDEAWDTFRGLRAAYAPIAYDLAYWILAAPAPWSGERHGFPGLVDRPESPAGWSLL
jgi:hypothetical protein